jgi:hypothetical protein
MFAACKEVENGALPLSQPTDQLRTIGIDVERTAGVNVERSLRIATVYVAVGRMREALGAGGP